MSKINELTVYRESNGTLRVEREAKGKRVTELDASSPPYCRPPTGPLALS